MGGEEWLVSRAGVYPHRRELKELWAGFPGQGKPHRRGLKELWAGFPGRGKPHRRGLKESWAVFPGRGKPRPYNTRLVAPALYFTLATLVTILAGVSCVLLPGQSRFPQQHDHRCP